MTGVVTIAIQAETLDDAVQKATERWRQIMDKEDAELPWSSHFNAVETDDSDTQLTFTVVIEFDRTVVDGAATS
jgi:hypothetical protein